MWYRTRLMSVCFKFEIKIFSQKYKEINHVINICGATCLEQLWKPCWGPRWRSHLDTHFTWCHVWLVSLTDTCDTSALKLGYDMCLCPVGKFCRMRRSRQHLLDLQPQDSWRQRAREPRAVWTQRILVMLPIPWWQPDCHQLRWYDLVSCWPLPLCR